MTKVSVVSHAYGRNYIKFYIVKFDTLCKGMNFQGENFVDLLKIIHYFFISVFKL